MPILVRIVEPLTLGGVLVIGLVAAVFIIGFELSDDARDLSDVDEREIEQVATAYLGATTAGEKCRYETNRLRKRLHGVGRLKDCRALDQKYAPLSVQVSEIDAQGEPDAPNKSASVTFDGLDGELHFVKLDKNWFVAGGTESIQASNDTTTGTIEGLAPELEGSFARTLDRYYRKGIRKYPELELVPGLTGTITERAGNRATFVSDDLLLGLSEPGKPFILAEGTFRVTSEFERRDDEWQLVSVNPIVAEVHRQLRRCNQDGDTEACEFD